MACVNLDPTYPIPLRGSINLADEFTNFTIIFLGLRKQAESFRGK
jgi:hypothetical protein